MSRVKSSVVLQLSTLRRFRALHRFPALAVAAVLLTAPVLCQPLPDRVELGNLGTGEAIVFTGENNDWAGRELAGIGDFNGDGFDDFIIGARNSSQAYVVYGDTREAITDFDLLSLDGTNGFRIEGPLFDAVGDAVGGGGDVNGDGMPDLIVGAWAASGGGLQNGESYVVFGREMAPAVLDLDNLSGTNGFRIDGSNSSLESGHAVDTIGDFNGDGLDDFVVGAATIGLFTPAGEVYVFFGRTSWPASIETDSLNGTNGFLIEDPTDEGVGFELEGAGDINGDGLADLLIGAESANPNGTNSGKVFVVFGRTAAPASVSLQDLDGSNGFSLNGEASSDAAGIEVSPAGDVNEDGFDDLLVGAYLNDAPLSASGAAYLVYGKSTWGASVELSSLDGSTGTKFNGIVSLDYAGYGVGGTIDFDGDGQLDLTIGARNASPNGSASGEAYVILSPSAFGAEFDLADLNGANGTAFEGESAGDEVGYEVEGVGDFNGDGLEDVAFGQNLGGETYLVFGRYETGISLGATAPSCPGLVTLRSKGLAPNATLELYRGSDRGTSVIGAGACSGTTLDLADAVLVRNFSANGLGQWIATVNLGAPTFCDTPVQIVDTTSCEESNVTRIPAE